MENYYLSVSILLSPTTTHMAPKDYLTTIRDAVRKDNMEVALKLLQELLNGSDQLTEALAQSGRYAAIKKDIRLGTISTAAAAIEKNRIRWAILDFLTELEIQEMEDTNLQQTLERARSSPVYHQQAEKIYNIDNISGGAVFN